MLILSRLPNEEVRITCSCGSECRVMVVDVRSGEHKIHGRARLGFTAPKTMSIHREEVFQRIQRAGDEGKGVLS